jgi:hypothetical protein
MEGKREADNRLIRKVAVIAKSSRLRTAVVSVCREAANWPARHRAEERMIPGPVARRVLQRCVSSGMR